MKTQKLMTLDEDLVQRLREEENASLLVNNLLREHYAVPHFKDKLKNIEAKKKEAEAKIEAINEEAEKIKAEAEAMEENAKNAEKEKEKTEEEEFNELQKERELRQEYELLCSEGKIDFRTISFERWKSQ